MVAREFLIIPGGLDAPRISNVRVLPLSYDVLEGFSVVHAIPSAEPVQHPLQASRTVCQMPDGRAVLVEMAGSAGSVHGDPVALREAIDIAHRVLATDGCGGPLDAHSLALAFLHWRFGCRPAPAPVSYGGDQYAG